MADVFISYSSKDREIARGIAAAVAARGHSVWWDRDIVAGESFDQVIEKELESARAVIVIWTPGSVASEWVRNEAASAAERGVLVPVSVDAGKLPLEFRRRQTADLDGWGGDPTHEGFQSLCRGLDKLLGEGASRARPAEPGVRPARKDRRYAWLAVLLFGILAVGGYLLFNPQHEATLTAVDTAAEEPALEALVAGRYMGSVVSDSKGSSRSDIAVTITALGTNKVRLSSPYERMGTLDIEVTRVGNQVLNAGGDTPFIVDLGAKPPTLSVSPHNELAYQGVKR